MTEPGETSLSGIGSGSKNSSLVSLDKPVGKVDAVAIMKRDRRSPSIKISRQNKTRKGKVKKRSHGGEEFPPWLSRDGDTMVIKRVLL